MSNKKKSPPNNEKLTLRQWSRKEATVPAHFANTIGANVAGSMQRIADALENINARQEGYDHMAFKVAKALPTLVSDPKTRKAIQKLLTLVK